MDLLGRTEEVLLLTIWRLQDEAYGLSIRDEICAKTGSEWSIGAIYAPLHRLERKGLVTTKFGLPEAKRGGRRTVLYHLTQSGKNALLDTKAVQDALWTGILTLKRA
jgi:PadR family transcriptional regulator, regulatory protein PadR